MGRRELTTWVVFVGVSAVWRLAPVAWRFGPTQACQGVGCRYCGACVPADGRGSCVGGRWGGAIRPALNPLYERTPGPPRRDATPRPGAVRAPPGSSASSAAAEAASSPAAAAAATVTWARDTGTGYGAQGGASASASAAATGAVAKAVTAAAAAAAAAVATTGVVGAASASAASMGGVTTVTVTAARATTSASAASAVELAAASRRRGVGVSDGVGGLAARVGCSARGRHPTAAGASPVPQGPTREESNLEPRQLGAAGADHHREICAQPPCQAAPPHGQPGQTTAERALPGNPEKAAKRQREAGGGHY